MEHPSNRHFSGAASSYGGVAAKDENSTPKYVGSRGPTMKVGRVFFFAGGVHALVFSTNHEIWANYYIPILTNQ